MKKKFELPKDFATKWLEALRSGLYKQGGGELVVEQPLKPEVLLIENCSFCCLGVAGSICDVPFEKMYGRPYFDSQLTFPDVPKILVEDDGDEVVRYLSNLNDDTYTSLDEIIDRGWIVRPELIESIKAKKRKLTFLEIADLIEDNFEFVDQTVEEVK